MATGPSPDSRLWPCPAVLPHRHSHPQSSKAQSPKPPSSVGLSPRGTFPEPALCRAAHLPRLRPSAVWEQGERLSTRQPAGPGTGLVLTSHHRVPRAPRVMSTPRTWGEGRSAEAKAEVQSLLKWDPGYWVALLGRNESRLDLRTRSPALGASSSPSLLSGILSPGESHAGRGSGPPLQPQPPLWGGLGEGRRLHVTHGGVPNGAASTQRPGLELAWGRVASRRTPQCGVGPGQLSAHGPGA